MDAITIRVRRLDSEFINKQLELDKPVSVLSPLMAKQFFSLAKSERVNVNPMDFDLIPYPQYGKKLWQKMLSNALEPVSFFVGKEEELAKKFNEYYSRNEEGVKIFSFEAEK